MTNLFYLFKALSKKALNIDISLLFLLTTLDATAEQHATTTRSNHQDVPATLTYNGGTNTAAPSSAMTKYNWKKWKEIKDMSTCTRVQGETAQSHSKTNKDMLLNDMKHIKVKTNETTPTLLNTHKCHTEGHSRSLWAKWVSNRIYNNQISLDKKLHQVNTRNAYVWDSQAAKKGEYVNTRVICTHSHISSAFAG